MDDAVDREREEQQAHHDAVVRVALLGCAEEAEGQRKEGEWQQLCKHAEETGRHGVDSGAGPRANAKPLRRGDQHGGDKEQEGNPVAADFWTHGLRAGTHGAHSATHRGGRAAAHR